MSKLHFYKKVSKQMTWVADGDGKVSPKQEFTVKITKGSVDEGSLYSMSREQRPDQNLPSLDASFPPMYVCCKSASIGGWADFKRIIMAKNQKTVSILIDQQDLDELKTNGYKLCFATKVGNHNYNVVWQSYDLYLTNNVFSWTPKYQIFGTNTFKAGVKVTENTNFEEISLGEKCILTKEGILSPPVTGTIPGSIELVNEYGLIHPCLSQMCTGIDGVESSTPIYAAQHAIKKGTDKMTPINKVQVWFDQNITTSTMFSEARSNPVEIDLTSTDSEVRRYTGGKWIIPGDK